MNWLIDIIQNLIKMLVDVIVSFGLYVWNGLFSTSMNLIGSLLPKFLSLGMAIIFLMFLNDILDN